MKKRVYSIVLSEEVVDAIDDLALTRNTSRSGIIDRILAEHVSCTTPEQHIQEIIKLVELSLAGRDTLHPLPRPTGGTLDISTRLKYRYRPTVKYSLELFPAADGPFGLFRASLRTQNVDLLEKFTEFLILWARMEDEYLPGRLGRKIIRELEPGKLSRRLTRPPDCDNTAEPLAAAAVAYVNAFDSSLKAFFAYGSDAAGSVFLKWLQDKLLS